MGYMKDQEQQREDAWGRAGKRCQVCGSPVPLSEKESYFKTGMCGYCQHVAEKDD